MQFTVEKARKVSGFTQKEMGDKMGICRSTYINIEKNPDRATIGQAKKIAKITKIPLDQIFFGNNSTTSR